MIRFYRICFFIGAIAGSVVLSIGFLNLVTMNIFSDPVIAGIVNTPISVCIGFFVGTVALTSFRQSFLRSGNE
jgi:hypothetical protein